jgi:TRAP-type C4-dicarboxylate transport system permease small subunit
VTLLKKLAIWIGGTALLAATAIDTFAVVGRQVGIPLRGSIELVQAAVLVAGSIALILSTLADRHARVRLLVDRLSENRRRISEAISSLATALFFACLLIGSTWLAADLWFSHEMSEIARVPWLWLRLFANLGLFVTVLIAGRSIVQRARRT